MMPMRGVRQLRIGAAAAAAALLASCGGENARFLEEPSETVAEGIYAGTVTGGTAGATAFQALILENDDVWVLYGANAAAGFSVQGFVQGNGTSGSGNYNSSSARDFGFVPAAAAPLTATYNGTAMTIAGSFQPPGAAVQFTGGPVQGITYNYNVAASLTTLLGSWTLEGLQGETVTLNIAVDGAASFSSSNGCNGTGTFTPRASGKNVFDTSFTFAAGTACALAGQSATGIAIAYNIPGTSQQQLSAAVINTDRTLGAAVSGVR